MVAGETPALYRDRPGCPRNRDENLSWQSRLIRRLRVTTTKGGHDRMCPGHSDDGGWGLV